MNTEYSGRLAGLYKLLKKLVKRLLAPSNAPQRPDSPKTVGMFAGSLVSQEYGVPNKQHPGH